MRDRHRRQILNLGAPPQERRRQRGKDENNDIWEHCEQPFLPGRNTEKQRFLGAPDDWLRLITLRNQIT